MLKKIVFLSGGLALSAAPVLAQSAYTSYNDWTGGYIGAQLGYADVGTSLDGVDGDDIIGGIIAGYDYDLGDWVVGGGLDYDMASIDLSGAAEVENVIRAKVRAGYKMNNGLLYATAGWARADTDTLGDSDGYLFGIGYDVKMSGGYTVGTELLYHKFDDFNDTGIDVDATTIQFRVGYNF
ncbi:outer membrane protein [Falsihalocynthiibacter sp. SS001]|uniref:outer membrane protein n=1 Tax=Falsihalocynthiibacter sp. SS001 TaxID=3349698 RepID=UPI0036D34A8D